MSRPLRCPDWCRTDHDHDDMALHRAPYKLTTEVLPAGQLAGPVITEWVGLTVETREGHDEDPRMHSPHLVIRLDTDECDEVYLSPAQALALAEALTKAARDAEHEAVREAPSRRGAALSTARR